MNKRLLLTLVVITACLSVTVGYCLTAFSFSDHVCSGEDCSVCRIVEATKDIILALCAVTVSVGITELIYSFIADRQEIIFYKNANLVLQGVKLSS